MQPIAISLCVFRQVQYRLHEFSLETSPRNSVLLAEECEKPGNICHSQPDDRHNVWCLQHVCRYLSGIDKYLWHFVEQNQFYMMLAEWGEVWFIIRQS